MERLPVQSSVLAAVAYDPIARRFEAEFRSGEIYQYAGVPAELYQRLLTAESIGIFFNLNIRNHFPHTLVPRPRSV